jgi:hypothetical protein
VADGALGKGYAGSLWARHIGLNNTHLKFRNQRTNAAAYQKGGTTSISVGRAGKTGLGINFLRRPRPRPACAARPASAVRAGGRPHLRLPCGRCGGVCGLALGAAEAMPTLRASLLRYSAVTLFRRVVGNPEIEC